MPHVKTSAPTIICHAVHYDFVQKWETHLHETYARSHVKRRHCVFGEQNVLASAPLRQNTLYIPHNKSGIIMINVVHESCKANDTKLRRWNIVDSEKLHMLAVVWMQQRNQSDADFDKLNVCQPGSSFQMVTTHTQTVNPSVSLNGKQSKGSESTHGCSVLQVELQSCPLEISSGAFLKQEKKNKNKGQHAKLQHLVKIVVFIEGCKSQHISSYASESLPTFINLALWLINHISVAYQPKTFCTHFQCRFSLCNVFLISPWMRLINQKTSMNNKAGR